jgi:hypothetical protein
MKMGCLICPFKIKSPKKQGFCELRSQKPCLLIFSSYHCEGESGFGNYY